jgi:hypothetical protein
MNKFRDAGQIAPGGRLTVIVPSAHSGVARPAGLAYTALRFKSPPAPAPLIVLGGPSAVSKTAVVAAANPDFRTPSEPLATHGNAIKAVAEREHVQRPPVVVSMAFPYRPSPSNAGPAPRADDPRVEGRGRAGLPLDQHWHSEACGTSGPLPPPSAPSEVTSRGSHHRRVRYCGDCISGEHDLDSASWRTDFLRLVRLHCACEACDCTFRKVHIEEPRFYQRHQQPVASRNWRTRTRRAA